MYSNASNNIPFHTRVSLYMVWRVHPQVHHHDYYEYRVLSIVRPLEVVTIIHDKMDHAKIACLCYAHKDKAIDGLFRLHVSFKCTFGFFLFKIHALFRVGLPNLLLIMLTNFNNCLENVNTILPTLLALVKMSLFLLILSKSGDV